MENEELKQNAINIIKCLTEQHNKNIAPYLNILKKLQELESISYLISDEYYKKYYLGNFDNLSDTLEINNETQTR